MPTPIALTADIYTVGAIVPAPGFRGVEAGQQTPVPAILVVNVTGGNGNGSGGPSGPGGDPASVRPEAGQIFPRGY